MNMRRVSVCLAVAASITLIVVACTITPTHAPGVSIHETSIEIYPGTKISSKDQKALDTVLKHFDKALYKIQAYDGGKLVTAQGSLENALIPLALITEVKKASQHGTSNWTLVCYNPAQSPMKDHSSLWYWFTAQQIKEGKQFVSRVTPILQKYSYDQVATVAKSGGVR